MGLNYLSIHKLQCLYRWSVAVALRWRHNDHDGVSNHQPRGWLLNRLFTRRSKKTSKLRVTGLCTENSPGPVNSPHKGPVTRKMLPFDDVIMDKYFYHSLSSGCNYLSMLVLKKWLTKCLSWAIDKQKILIKICFICINHVCLNFRTRFLYATGRKFYVMSITNYLTHKIPINSQYNDGYCGRRRKFWAKY